MKLVSGIVDSGFFAQSALSAEVATKDSLGRNISETYLTSVDLTPYQTTADMVNYQTTAGMTAYQSAGEYYSASNPSGFLVADDITGKLDASVYAADSGNFLTAIPDTYLQNTDLSTTDGKVTAISGIPLSAGGDVPEGVMVESGLEYNAVNEISGYNGSAIAQYGAEKQWLVHDDTLVHAANSAQYALGVNLSAVAQLLGVDETVLFTQPRTSTTTVTAFTLTEKPSNFDRIRFNGYVNAGRFSVEIPVDNTTDTTMRFGSCSYSPDNYGSPLQLYGISYSSNNGLNWTKVRETLRWFNQTTVTAVTGITNATNPVIYDIVGIGRKQ